MSTPATIPIFDPTGTLRDVPQDQLQAAVKAGGMPAVKFQAPDNSVRFVPANRTHEAVQAGGTIAPIQQQDIKHPGFWNTLYDDVKGLGASVLTAGPTSSSGPTDADIAYDEKLQREGHGKAYRLLMSLTPDSMRESAESGNVAGVYGHVAGQTVPVVGGLVTPSATAIDTLPLKAPTAAVLRGVSDVIDPEVTGVFSPRIAHAQRLAGRIANALGQKSGEVATPELIQAAALKTGPQVVADPAAGLGQIPVKAPGAAGSITEAVTGPPSKAVALDDFVARMRQQEAQRAARGNVLTEEPPEKMSQSQIDAWQKSIFNKEPVDLDVGKKVREANPEPTRLEVKAAAKAKLEQLLNDSMDVKKPVPGVPLKDQPAAQALASGKLPEGFSPVDSTALKGYKYDPTTREFESITQGGQHYVYGDVAPEDVKAFESAESKGKAWMDIRNNPLIAKVIKGKRIPVKPARAILDAQSEDK